MEDVKPYLDLTWPGGGGGGGDNGRCKTVTGSDLAWAG